MITVVTEYDVSTLKKGDYPFVGHYLIETKADDGTTVRTAIHHQLFETHQVWAAHAFKRAMREMGYRSDVHRGRVSAPTGTTVKAIAA